MTHSKEPIRKLAKEKGCISGMTWVRLIQALEFFQILGYETFAVSEGWYHNGVKEFEFIKRS